MPLASSDLSHPRYEILDLLGEGGMGRVFRARDRETDRTVALKTLKECGPEDRRRFEDEIRMLGRLHHEAIVELHDLGTMAGELFFAMEYLQGVSLDTFVGGPAPAAREIHWLADVALEVLDALGYVHSAGALHSDLKPSNVMVLCSPTCGGENSGRPSLAQLAGAGETRVKLLDFGVARRGNAWEPRSLAREKRRAGPGTPLYMAPEQAAGEALDGRADLYSLGALLYHLIGGEPPYLTLEKALSPRACARPPRELNPECDEELSALILRLLERDPGRRPASAEEVAGRLRRLRARSSPAGPSPRPRLVPAAFTGRRAEVDTIRGALAEAASGKGRLLRITGEAGTGKSWILHRSGVKSEMVLDHGGAFVTARIPRAGLPSEALARAFPSLLEVAGNPERGPEVERILGPWASALLETLGRPPSGRRRDGDGTNLSGDAPTRVLRERFLDTALRLVEAAAARKPLLLAFEDIENAGELEIEFISRLSRRAPSLRLLLIVTYRTGGSSGSPCGRWLEDVERRGEAPPLRLDALSDAELAALTRRSLRPRGDPSPELLSFLRERTGGRTGELGGWLGFLRDEGALALGDGLWGVVDPPAEKDAQDRVAERLENLSGAPREVLQGVAVIGEAAPPGEVALLLGRKECRGELSSLAAAGLLVETPEGFELGPLVTPEALRIPASRARELHLRAAELVLDADEPPLRRSFRLARHFRAAGLADRAVGPLLEAAEEAARIHANLQAAGAYREALELARDRATRSRIARRLGGLHARTGENEEALEALLLAEREILASGPDDGARERLDLWDEIGRVLHRRGQLERAEEYFERSLRESGGDPSRRARAHARLGGVAFDRGDLGRARSHYEEAMALEDPVSDAETFVAACSGLGLVEKGQGRGEAAIERFREAIEAAESSGRLDEAATILNNLGNLLRARGRTEEAVACLERSLEIRERFGDRQGLAICLNNIARVQGLRGELRAARDATSQSLSIFEEIGDRKGVLIARCNLGELLVLEGRAPEARRHLEETLRLARSSGAAGLEKSVLLNISRARREEGDPRGGEESLARVLDRDGGTGRAHELPALTLLAECLLDQGRVGDAAATLREAGRTGGAALDEGPVDLLAARVRLLRLEGDPERAKALGTRFLAAVPANADRHGLALLHRQLGATYRELGPDWADRTEKHLRHAHAEFESMGSRHEAAESLAQLGKYWELLGEEEAARAERELASRTFRRLGLLERAGAVERGEVRP